MSDTIRITASLRMERPAEVVRQQYRDIDHHIRNDVHPSIRYQWEPAEPGQRKIRTTFRILGVPQYDVSLLEDAPDGSFVIRYLEGTNAGMVLVHRFVPLGPDATNVELTADAPATLARKLLGPLFVAGGRQVMKKALAEDKRDLEQGLFHPGKAAGNLDGALGSLSGLRGRDAATQRAVLEAACLVAVADGSVDASERDAIARLAAFMGGGDEEHAFVDARLGELIAAASSERIAAEATRAGRELVAARVGLEGVSAAVIVALVSEGMSLGELELLRHLAAAADIPDGSLAPLVEGADRVLGE
ncbi:MAG TPA: hypothetical protein VMI54_29785 [Polyangiaceae bacterium]|nr:hypothetical protein [Polyangiaceae bacterium]